MTDRTSLGRSQRRRTAFVLGGNLLFLGLFLAVVGLTVLKFMAVSGTPHPETIGYHATVFAPYLVANAVVMGSWRVFQDKSGQSELLSQFETSTREDPERGGR